MCRRAKLDKWRQEDSAKKMRRATFQPNLAAPCVCGVSMGLQDSHEMGMLEEHSCVGLAVWLLGDGGHFL